MNSANFMLKSLNVESKRQQFFSFDKSYTFIKLRIICIASQSWCIVKLFRWPFSFSQFFQNTIFIYTIRKDYVMTLSHTKNINPLKTTQIDIKMIGKISLVILIHCVYSLLRYRKYLLASQEPLQHLPTDIIVEIFFGLVLGIVSILSQADKFKNLRDFVPVKTYDASFTGKNLANFNSSRAQMFLQILKQKYKTQTFLLNEA